jgi:hypothetical protein
MSESLPPLPDDLARVFARANAESERDEVLADVRSRVSRAMALRGVPGFDVASPPGEDAQPHDDLLDGEVPGNKGAGTGDALVAKALAVKAAALAATAGLAVGFGAGHEWGARAPRGAAPMAVVASASTAVAPPSASSERSVSVDELPAVPQEAPRAPSSARNAPTPSASIEDGPNGRSALRRERELVDGASGALRAGNAEQALALSEQAGRLFPGGQLAEEREALAIEALIVLGRRAEAKARTERFRERFPRSPAGARLSTKIDLSP